MPARAAKREAPRTKNSAPAVSNTNPPHDNNICSSAIDGYLVASLLEHFITIHTPPEAAYFSSAAFELLVTFHFKAWRMLPAANQLGIQRIAEKHATPITPSIGAGRAQSRRENRARFSCSCSRTNTTHEHELRNLRRYIFE
jgi:hypothetical protein